MRDKNAIMDSSDRKDVVVIPFDYRGCSVNINDSCPKSTIYQAEGNLNVLSPILSCVHRTSQYSQSLLSEGHMFKSTHLFTHFILEGKISMLSNHILLMYQMHMDVLECAFIVV